MSTLPHITHYHALPLSLPSTRQSLKALQSSPFSTHLSNNETELWLLRAPAAPSTRNDSTVFPGEEAPEEEIEDYGKQQRELSGLCKGNLLARMGLFPLVRVLAVLEKMDVEAVLEVLPFDERTKTFLRMRAVEEEQ